MRTPRSLRNHKRSAPKAVEEEQEAATDLPGTFYATSGFAVAERAGERRFEYGQGSLRQDMPVVMGFRPNNERKAL